MNTTTGESDEAALLAVASSKSTTVAPAANRTGSCNSCGAIVTHTYCGQCGQKDDDLRRSLFRLISETLGGIFSFESRMWRTWGALIFKPGKVARDYADGARERYSPPIKVYLVVSFLLFGFLAVSNTNIFTIQLRKTATPDTTTLTFGNRPSEDAGRATAVNDAEVSDVQETQATEQSGSETDFKINDFDFELNLFQSQKKFEATLNKEEAEAFINSLNESGEMKVEVNQEAIDVRKIVKTIFLQPNKFNAAFNTWLPRLMFFMVPVAMFFGVVFIRGRGNALLYDHLIHSFYVHSVFFMSLILAIVAARVAPGAAVAGILGLFLVIYLNLSVKTMFKRGWIKTIWTSLSIGFVYLLFLFTAIVLIAVYSASQLGS